MGKQDGGRKNKKEKQEGRRVTDGSVSPYILPNKNCGFVHLERKDRTSGLFCERFVAASTLSAGAAQAKADQNQSVAEGV